MTQRILNVVSDFSKQLAASVSIGDTTAELNNALDSEGVQISNNTIYGFTVDTGAKKEYIIATLSSNTQLSNIFSISPQGASTTGFTKAHGVGASVQITDWAALSRISQTLRGTIDLDSGVPLKYDGTAAQINPTALATVQFVIDTASGSTVLAYNPQTIDGVVGENVTAGDWVYLDEYDGKWWKTDADDSGKSVGVKIGKVRATTVADAAVTGGIFIGGTETLATYVAGTTYYLSNTAGELSTSAGTNSVKVGVGDVNGDLVVTNNNPNELTPAEKSAVSGLAGMTGIIAPYGGRSAPSGWLLCDGSAVSRTTYASLFAVLVPSGTFTVTIASPAVFTKTAHGLVAGDKLHFTTTGALPTGLSTNTDYYVIAAGLTADDFQVALSPGGAAVVTTGSQSGVHTLYISNFGKGDGSTTFNLPDLRAKVPVGKGQTTFALKFESAAVSTGSDTVTILDYAFPAQGQKVQLTTTDTLPTGLSTSTDYWIIRASSTTIKFASSLDNANAGTAIDITGAGSGVHTMTFTGVDRTVIGLGGGEEIHAISTSELATHLHSVSPYQSGAGGVNSTMTSGFNTATITATGSTGGNSPHNNMQPFITLNYIIKT